MTLSFCKKVYTDQDFTRNSKQAKCNSIDVHSLDLKMYLQEETSHTDCKASFARCSSTIEGHPEVIPSQLELLEKVGSKVSRPRLAAFSPRNFSAPRGREVTLSSVQLDLQFLEKTGSKLSRPRLEASIQEGLNALFSLVEGETEMMDL
mmetsp:Transcript_35179/g.44821  ORF Transcript_35179/g.44821 Transcript_35179/m.44821 type:complete len:149 (+) Transcript_35179:96-542(+)